MDSCDIEICLVGNYIPDRQESMQRFAHVLLELLPSYGISVSLLKPRVQFGRLSRSRRGLGKWFGYLDKFVLFPRDLKQKLSTSQGQRRFLVHICDHSNAIYTRFLRAFPHLVTCNDLLAVRSALGEFPENPTRWTGRRLQRSIMCGLNRAQHVTCISEATRRDLLRLSTLIPSAVSLTYMGLNYDYHPMESGAARQICSTVLPENASNRGFFLHVGGNQWYKNRLGLLRMYETLLRHGDCPALVMAGEQLSPEMESFIHRAGLSGHVYSIVNPGNEELRALYSLAEILIFPSLQEGFGWPIIEAQACGCRVLTSDRVPMTEIGSGAAFYCDPENPESASAVIREMLSQSEQARTSTIEFGLKNAARFTGSAMLQQYVALYRQLAGQIGA